MKGCHEKKNWPQRQIQLYNLLQKRLTTSHNPNLYITKTTATRRILVSCDLYGSVSEYPFRRSKATKKETHIYSHTSSNMCGSLWLVLAIRRSDDNFYEGLPFFSLNSIEICVCVCLLNQGFVWTIWNLYQIAYFQPRQAHWKLESQSYSFCSIGHHSIMFVFK